MTRFASDLRNAALVVASLDNETAHRLLAQLEPPQRAAVEQAVRTLGPIDPAQQRAAMVAFVRATRGYADRPELLPTQSEPAAVHARHARNVAAANAGPHVPLDDTYTSVGSIQPHPTNEPPFGFLHETQDEQILSLLTGEQPQTISLVMAHLSSDRAARLIARLDPDVQVEVLRRMVDLEETDPEILHEVERGLESRLARIVHAQRRKNAGLAAVTQMLEAADPQVEQQILSNLTRHDQGLAGRLVQQRTGGHELEELDDATLLKVVELAEPELVILALAGSGSEVVQRLLSKLPPREARLLRHALENLGPTRLGDVESARQKLLQLSRRFSPDARRKSDTSAA